MVPFEYLVDSRHASKDAIYGQLTQPIAASPLVHDRQFLCGALYVDPAVPVARPRGPMEPASFNYTIPGASQRVGTTPPAHETPKGLPPAGPGNPNAPPMFYTNPAERERAALGRIGTPPPFTNFIAPH